MTKQRESGITWTEETWNPVRGCSRVSKGCMHCYAEGVANRFKGAGMPYEGLIASTGQWNGTVKMIEDKLLEPIRWKRPRLIFVNSMSDLFHESLTDEQIDKVLAVMAVASHHTFQVLTKRAKRMRDYFRSGDWEIRACKEAEKLGHHLPELFFAGGLPNVWIGVSVENQEAANERIPYLLDTPAAVRWVSAEPLLGAVDLTKIPYRFNPHAKYKMVKSVDALAGQVASHDPGFPVREGEQTKTIDWVVVGGESGTGARPMHPEWARSLRDQCVAAGVKFHFKQWGAWRPESSAGYWTGPKTKRYPQRGAAMLRDGRIACEQLSAAEILQRAAKGERPIGTVVRDESALAAFRAQWKTDGPDVGYQWMFNVGKKESGRILDGRTWDEFPGGAA